MNASPSGEGKSISRLLFTGYVLVLILLGLTWGAGAYSAAQTNSRITHIVVVNDALLNIVSTRNTLLDDEETGLRGYLLTGQSQFLQPYVHARHMLPHLRSTADALGRRIVGATPLMAVAKRDALTWENWAAKIMRHVPAHPRSAAAVAQQLTGKRLFDRYRAASSVLDNFISTDRSRELRQSRQTAGRLNRIDAAILIIAVFLTVAIGWLTMRALMRPLRALSLAADAIGDGDLRVIVSARGTREFTYLARRMDHMRLSLAEEAASRQQAEEELRQETARRAAIITVLNDIASSGLDLSTVLSLITERAQDLTGAAAAVVEMVDGDDMVYRAASGTSAAHVGLRIPRATSLSGQCSLNDTMVYCDDSETDPRVDRQACRLVGARSMIIVPLRQKAETVGILKVLSSQPHDFDAADIDTLQVIASVLGAALGQATAFNALGISEKHLQAKTREQESFIYTVSHDLRAPLVSLQGLVNILSDDYGDQLDADGRHYLKRISVNATKMQGLLTELLDLARVGRIETELTPVAVNDVVHSVLEQLRPTLDQRGAEVVLDGPLPTVLGNVTRLSQLFTNLVDNAVHYTPAERSPRIVISAFDRSHQWEITVADNGVGIPATARDKIFGLFQRLPAGKSLNPGGSGVGLAIIARVVETHGGELWLESVEGTGTTFHFTVPKPTASENDTPAAGGIVTSEAA